ncbi:MAG: Gfo/Idh/MocA family oxidoreductase [Candidatus Latescibacteria bacterium]|nr:Gfo/Idh/MocA family oxidoreductase [Candidatus Latescibacterota bacterium]
MSTFKVGIIGCGRPRRSEGATGFGISHHHAAGYLACPDTEIVACADIKPENAEAFAQKHNVPRTYEDYREMLTKERPDIVSVCVWIALHAPIVLDCARAGVKAIHSEKPMAPTFGEAVDMVRVCAERGVQLTFNHQRRFEPSFRKARDLARSGVVGQIRQMEGYCGNILDLGTHWIDMMCFFNDDQPAEWVIGQVDSREEKLVFGVPVENQALCSFQWKNGVRGLLETGPGIANAGCSLRLLGADGIIEVGVPDGPAVRYASEKTSGWVVPEIEGGLRGGDIFTRAIFDLVDALKTGREPELSGRKALQATEVIFACYESSRRRARIDLPLDIRDSPFLDMLAKRQIGPNRQS